MKKPILQIAVLTVACGIAGLAAFRAVVLKRMPVANSPELVWKLGHTGPVDSLAWSPDGRMLASGGADGSIRLWRPGTGELLRVIRAHLRNVQGLAWGPGGRALVSGGEEGRIRFWQPDTGTLLNSIDNDSPRSLTWSPDGRKIAGAVREMEDQSKVQVWDAASGAVLRTIGGGGEGAEFVESVAWAPDSESLLVSSASQMRLFKIDSGRVVREFPAGEAGGFQSLAWLPGGGSFVTLVDLHPETRAGHELRRIQADTGKVLWNVPDKDYSRAVAWSPDGKFLATGDGETVKLWNAATGAPLKTLSDHRGSRAVAWSPDSRTLAAGNEDGSIQFWRADTGVSTQTIAANPNMLYSVAWSPDGQTLASGGSDQTVKIWSARSGTLIRSLSGHTRRVRGVAWSPDGKMLASASADQTVRLWDAASGSSWRSLHNQDESSTGLPADQPDASPPPMAWSPDGSMIAAAAEYPGSREVRLWRAATGELVRTIHSDKDLSDVKWTPDGKRIAATQGGALFWSADTGEPAGGISILADAGLLAYQPGGKLLAMTLKGSDVEAAMLQIWPVPSPQTDPAPRCFTDNTGYVFGMTWSPDGQSIATAGLTGGAAVWRADNCQSIRKLGADDGEFDSVAWSPDGRTIATAGRDGTIRQWNAASGELERLTVLLPGGQWITTNPKNLLYASSPGAEDFAAIRYEPASSVVKPLSAFHNRLHRSSLDDSASRPVIQPDWQYVAAGVASRHRLLIGAAVVAWCAAAGLIIGMRRRAVLSRDQRERSRR